MDTPQWEKEYIRAANEFQQQWATALQEAQAAQAKQAHTLVPKRVPISGYGGSVSVPATSPNLAYEIRGLEIVDYEGKPFDKREWLTMTHSPESVAKMEALELELDRIKQRYTRLTEGQGNAVDYQELDDYVEKIQAVATKLNQRPDTSIPVEDGAFNWQEDTHGK